MEPSHDIGGRLRGTKIRGIVEMRPPEQGTPFYLRPYQRLPCSVQCAARSVSCAPLLIPDPTIVNNSSQDQETESCRRDPGMRR